MQQSSGPSCCHICRVCTSGLGAVACAPWTGWPRVLMVPCGASAPAGLAAHAARHGSPCWCSWPACAACLHTARAACEVCMFAMHVTPEQHGRMLPPPNCSQGGRLGRLQVLRRTRAHSSAGVFNLRPVVGCTCSRPQGVHTRCQDSKCGSVPTDNAVQEAQLVVVRKGAGAGPLEQRARDLQHVVLGAGLLCPVGVVLLRRHAQPQVSAQPPARCACRGCWGGRAAAPARAACTGRPLPGRHRRRCSQMVCVRAAGAQRRLQSAPMPSTPWPVGPHVCDDVSQRVGRAPDLPVAGPARGVRVRAGEQPKEGLGGGPPVNPGWVGLALPRQNSCGPAADLHSCARSARLCCAACGRSSAQSSPAARAQCRLGLAGLGTETRAAGCRPERLIG